MCRPQLPLQLQRDCFAVITLKISRYGKLGFGLCLNKNCSKPWQGKISDHCFLRQKKREVI